MSDTTHNILWNFRYQTIWDAGGTDVVDASQATESWSIQLPNDPWSVLVDTKVGSAVPASETSLPSPFTFYWLMGDLENVT